MKKKTATAILLTPAIMLMVMGFNTVPASNVSAEETTSTAEVNSTISISADSIEYKGQSFSGLDDLQSALDKANSVSKFAPGYPFEMEEKNSLYYYDVISENDDTYSLCIATYNDNGTERIMQVSSNDPSAKTAKGIHTGNTKDELVAAYGEPNEINDCFYTYTFDKYNLVFKVIDNTVTMIGSENPAWYSDLSPAPADTTKPATTLPDAPLSDATIEYKGQTFSALDDLQTSLNKADPISKYAPGYPFVMQENNSLYYFDELSKKDDTYGLGIATFDNNGTETVLQIFSHDPNSKTSKGIHPGSTKDELIAAYGEPTEVSDNFYIYDFEKFGLNFIVKNDIVTMISSEHPDW